MPATPIGSHSRMRISRIASWYDFARWRKLAHCAGPGRRNLLSTTIFFLRGLGTNCNEHFFSRANSPIQSGLFHRVCNLNKDTFLESWLPRSLSRVVFHALGASRDNVEW